MVRTSTQAHRAAELALGVLLVCVASCTDGYAQPFRKDAGTETSTEAGRGGKPSNSGRGGRGGTDLNWNPSCGKDFTTSPDLAEQENLLTMYLIDGVLPGVFPCASPVFRAPLNFRDDPLRCAARQRAYIEENLATFGRVPSRGPGSNQTFAAPPSSVTFVKRGANATVAVFAFTMQVDFCRSLQNDRYNSAGVGLFGTTWVIILAPG